MNNSKYNPHPLWAGISPAERTRILNRERALHWQRKRDLAPATATQGGTGNE